MRQAHFTSFKRYHEDDSHGPKPEAFSVAVYQPRWFPQLPKIAWTDIRQEDGTWIRPREFLNDANPAEAYWQAILAHYDARRTEAEAWAQESPEYAALCCWCPYDKAAKRQLEQFGSFICHTGPLAHWLVSRLGIAASYDYDRCEGMYGVCESS